MTEEERERVTQIRERVVAKYQNVPSGVSMMECPGCGCAAFAATRDDIDFLLSLLDSQAAKGDAADRGINKLLLASDLTAEAYKKGWSDAATQMRDACVEKVKAARYYWEAKVPDDRLWGLWVSAANQIITDLESLTLEQVEQEQPK